MKKIILPILALFILSFTSSLSAWNPMTVTGSGGGGAAVTLACDESTANVFCEDFDSDQACGDGDSNCRQAWDTVYTAGNGDLDFNVSHNGTLSCTDKGSYAFQATHATSDKEYVEFDNGSETTAIYVSFYFNVVSESLNNGDISLIAKLESGVPQAMYYLAIQRQEADGFTAEDCVKDQNASWDCSSPHVSITTGVWYRARVEWTDGSPGTYNTWIGATQTHTNTTARADYEFQILTFPSDATEEAANVIQYDDIELDDSSMPGACN